jgi:dipeptidyl aminopeptidase/acylaminoacyl peptidase
MAWTVNDRGRSRLEARRLGDAGPPRILLDGGREGGNPVFADRAPVLVIGWGSATRPAAILRFDLGRPDPVGEEVTRPDLAGLDPAALVEPVERVFKSFDGLEISGFLFRPRNPIGSCVVLVHGGPEAQYRPGFDPLAQLLVARGHAVFAPNVRGSSGYGRKFTALDDARKRMDSVRDLEAVHAHLVETGVAPADRIAIMGGSYGGFMTLAALTHQPKLWAAGVDIVGIAHLGTFLKNTGAYRQRHRAAEYGDPEKDAEFFEQTAPLNHAKAIRAPLMVIQGKNDPRVPVSEAEQIVAAAKANGAEVEYLLYADEGHGLAKLKNRIEAYTRAAAFLDRVLKR